MTPTRVKTISEFLRWRGLPQPAHPLISVVDYADIKFLSTDNENVSAVFDFYSIAIKRDAVGKLFYGHEEYDFDQGIMFFTAPNQVLRLSREQLSDNRSGWILFIHPDFFWNTGLADSIKKYKYFGYSLKEALFLSEKEENKIASIIENIQEEYNANIDTFSKEIMISYIETLLRYAERFYNRQFITREKSAHKILDRLEQVLSRYFDDEQLLKSGLPTVEYISEALNISPNYLRGLLKVLTGKNTQQHIHEKLIEKAKEKLTTTNLTVSQIAYDLGFEHSQSFSKLFKSKTDYSPLKFKQLFN